MRDGGTNSEKLLLCDLKSQVDIKLSIFFMRCQLLSTYYMLCFLQNIYIFFMFSSLFLLYIKKNYFLFQVRDSDQNDSNREKAVQLLDDFKITGVNGTRILFHRRLKVSILFLLICLACISIYIRHLLFLLRLLSCDVQFFSIYAYIYSTLIFFLLFSRKFYWWATACSRACVTYNLIVATVDIFYDYHNPFRVYLWWDTVNY